MLGSSPEQWKKRDKARGRPRVDALIRCWLALYRSEYIRPFKNMMRRNASAHGGGRPRAVLVARPNGSAWRRSALARFPPCSNRA